MCKDGSCLAALGRRLFQRLGLGPIHLRLQLELEQDGLDAERPLDLCQIVNGLPEAAALRMSECGDPDFPQRQEVWGGSSFDPKSSDSPASSATAVSCSVSMAPVASPTI